MPNVYTFKDFEGSSHRILIELVERHARRGGTLLDLGAAAGELGAALRQRFERTIGFEYNADCVGELHGRFDHVVVADLERVKKLPGNVDAIVLADVLEHLRSPAHALALVREALAEDGHAFISVPNIANVTVRLGLLFGVFEYRDRGILDHTHLRFYTHRTIRREVENAGFRILERRGSSVPVRLIIGAYTPEIILEPLEKVLAWMTRLWLGLFAYQIILVAEKK